MSFAQKNLGVMAIISTIVLHIILLQILHISAESKISLPGCPESCGGMPIPYPFGIGLDCALSDGFNIYCGRSNDGTEIPYLMPEMSNYNYTILNISIPHAQARLNLPVTYSCYDITTATQRNGPIWETDCPQNPFWINTERNKFTVTGCHSMAYLYLDEKHNDSDRPVVGCLSTCNSRDNLNKYGPSCSGVGCCQTEIPMSTNHFYIEWDDTNFTKNSMLYNLSHCSYAMVTEVTSSFNTNYITTNELINRRMPAVFDWIIGDTTCKNAMANKTSYACKSENSECFNSPNGGYICNCSTGYEGNPYLLGGCQDIDECVVKNPCPKPSKCNNFPGGYQCSCPLWWRRTHNNNTQNSCELNLPLVIGVCICIVALSFLVFATYFLIERRKLSKVKQRYFQQHGGWILLEKIKSSQGFGFTIFTKKQLEQATNHFDNTNIIGHGGHGTVYKGILRGQTVAIKKCKIVNEGKTKEFGKEMLILSQINHKNIVKLLGCCLEVEVPMLVYEFMPNGTLFHYIHHKKRGSQISFATRLRIAHESAEALAYLHNSASPPIFHGDVKTTNILLDQNYKSKVSDFGASILVPTDDAQFVTFVQGTLGYLDPEYMQTSQLTDKSDVYSFGVVLVELLTGKLVFNYEAPEEERSLSSCFLSSMRENKVEEIIDDKIRQGDDMELIEEVAELAKECLNIKGEERPAMKQVAEELHRIRKLKQFSWGEENISEETWALLNEGSSHYYTESDYTSNYFSVDKEAEESIAIGR